MVKLDCKGLRILNKNGIDLFLKISEKMSVTVMSGNFSTYALPILV